MTAHTIKTEAVAAWHSLSGALVELEAEGRRVICRTDPEPFTSDDQEQRLEAVAACGGCLAIAVCRHFADANSEPAHVWGGIDRTNHLYRRSAPANGEVTPDPSQPDAVLVRSEVQR